jgi:hypothetical protein
MEPSLKDYLQLNTSPNKFKKPPKLSLLKKLNKPSMPPLREKMTPVLSELSNH